MNFEWTGVFPALTTKFTADDKLDFPLFEKNLKAQLDAGVKGVVLGGTLGEASVLTTTEKEQLIKFAVEKCAGKVPVILNIAEGSTKEALQQAAYATAWGAKGIMILPPMRYKSDHRETVTYFKTVADSTELPVMIYNNPVDYKIEVSAGVDIDKSFVPAMLLQPYVENAIRHGMRFLENKKGQINISIFTENKCLVCEIDDNGIGREKAASLKSKRHFEYQSKGMNISKRRAELYNIKQEVMDKKDEDGNAGGTTVTVKIPLDFK